VTGARLGTRNKAGTDAEAPRRGGKSPTRSGAWDGQPWRRRFDDMRVKLFCWPSLSLSLCFLSCVSVTIPIDGRSPVQGRGGSPRHPLPATRLAEAWQNSPLLFDCISTRDRVMRQTPGGEETRYRRRRWAGPSGAWCVLRQEWDAVSPVAAGRLRNATKKGRWSRHRRWREGQAAVLGGSCLD